MQRVLLLTALLLVAWTATASAQPHPWPFDFDPAIAEDPTGIEQGLDELGAGLPGLPPDGMVEVLLDEVNLYFFPVLADALLRARDAGPGLAPAVVRTPVTCAAHDSFEVALALVEPASATCRQAGQRIAAAFDGARRMCLEVEFPETYVFDHPPGVVETDTVTNFEGLIALAGEALRHLDYPDGLLPADFLPMARSVIAKLRYDTLRAQLDDRLDAYAGALAELASADDCFEAASAVAFTAAVDELTEELVTARQDLDDLYEQGLAQAALDRQAVMAQCRSRAELPHPALTDRERELLSFYIGAVYWRMRGAGLIAYPPDPEQGLLRRILYVKFPYQLIGDLTGGAGAEGVGDSILFDENWGWDEWWDMGTNPGSADKYSDLVGMTARGKRGVDVVGPQLEARGFDIRAVVAGGLQMGPCYYYAWWQLADFRLGDDLHDPYMWFVEWPTSLGEVCEGGALGVGLAKTMLWGTPIPEAECVPDCDGRECGSDGIGGSCGSCAADESCSSAGICEPTGDSGDPDDPGASDAGPNDPGAQGGDGTVGGCACSISRPPRPQAGSSWLLLALAAIGLAIARRARPRERRGSGG